MGKWHEIFKIPASLMLVLLTLINFIIYLDRGVLASVLTTLKNPPELITNSTLTTQPGLGLNSIQEGALGSLFMLGYMVAGPIFAYCAQIHHPLLLMAIGLIIWGISSVAAGLSTTFWQIAAARSFSGVGEASFVCLAPPFILDHAPEGRKTTWIAVFYSAIALGFALGYIFGNATSIALNGWYWPFYIQAILMIPFILICLLSHKDPKLLATRKHGDSQEVVSVFQQFKELGSNLLFVFITLGFTAFVFTLGALSFWTPTIMQILYNRTQSEANNILGGITFVCGVLGTLVGSLALDAIVKAHVSNKDISESRKFIVVKHTYTEYATILLTCTTLLACVSVVIGTVIGVFWCYAAGLGIGLYCIFLSKGPVAMALMNSVPDELRGQANAVAIFFMHLLGDFPSPYIVGWFIDYDAFWAAIFTYLWLIWASLFWAIAWNISRFHERKYGEVFKHFFGKVPKRHKEEEALLSQNT